MLQLIRQTSEYLLLTARPGFARVFNKHFKLYFFKNAYTLPYMLSLRGVIKEEENEENSNMY